MFWPNFASKKDWGYVFSGVTINLLPTEGKGSREARKQYQS
jgi:hypothetical protein